MRQLKIGVSLVRIAETTKILLLFIANYRFLALVLTGTLPFGN